MTRTIGPPRLNALATAVPEHVVEQRAARDGARRLFGGSLSDLDRRLVLFDNCGIDRRYMALPVEAYLTERGFGARNDLFLDTALDLLVEATHKALDRAGLEPQAIDAVVTVCSTGIATPSLDARLAERLHLRADVERTPLFGLGCAGGVLGLSRAAALARSAPGSRVLLLVVELCSLTLRPNDRSMANLVACALFGDGAAAAVISTDGDGVALGPNGEHRWHGTLDIMGWRVVDDGLGVLFAISVPEIARTRLRAAVDQFLDRHGASRSDVERWICHPGGAKVITALEEAIELAPGTLADSREVLRDYGNMSAPTVLFVLERALAEPDWRQGVVTALGPGFTAGFATLQR